jgi:hypothetical protein
MATDVGGTYRSEYKVYDAAGALVAPSTKTYTVTLPDQTTATPSISTVVAGDYFSDYVITVEGLHKFVWATTGPSTSKTDYENAWLYRSVVGLAEMREYLGQVSTVKDELIRELLSAATEMAEKIVGTCVNTTYTNVDIPGQARMQIRLPKGPLFSATGNITVASVWPGGPSWANSGGNNALIVHQKSAIVEPVNQQGFFYGPWKATYTAGRMVVPQRIVLAAKMIVYDLFAIQRGVLSDPLSPNYDEMSVMEARIPAGYEMPPQARALLMREARAGFA